MSYRISHKVSIRTCTKCFGSILPPIKPTCLPCKGHFFHVRVYPSTCQLLLHAGLFRVWPIGRIRSCRIHTGTRIPPWTPYSSITGNSSFNTRRYQPFRCPCLAWIGHVHALLRMIPFAPTSYRIVWCQWLFFSPLPHTTITHSIMSL